MMSPVRGGGTCQRETPCSARSSRACFVGLPTIPSIGRATVYRTLGRLADEGAIGRVRINNGADRFDHQAFAHYHVRCTCCGRVDDVMVPVLAGVDDVAAEATGYRITGHSLQFDGVCPACQACEASTA